MTEADAGRLAQRYRLELAEAPQVWFDEADSLTPKEMHAALRYYRKVRAKGGWFNWHVNRGRLALPPTDSELRRVSWRRAH